MRGGEPQPEQDPPGDPESVARTICLRLLTQRARTRAELASALRRRGVPDDAAARVLDRFSELRLIDDRTLAADYAMAAHQYRGLSRRAVAQKLRHRGVDEDTIRESVAGIDSDSEEASARALVARKQRSLGSVEPAARIRRLEGMLARRGYSAHIAHRVVREALGEAEREALDTGATWPVT